MMRKIRNSLGSASDREREAFWEGVKSVQEVHNPRNVCRHCGASIHTQKDGRWIHTDSESVWCNLGSTNKAALR